VEQERVLKNKKTVLTSGIKVSETDEIEILPVIQEEPVVLYEDSEILVVLKPENMSCARSSTTRKNELVLNEEIGKTRKLAKAKREEEFGLVHRLDKQTKGLVLLAKTQEAYDKFICTSSFSKKYVAFMTDQLFNFSNFSMKTCEHKNLVFSFGEECSCDLSGYELIERDLHERGTISSNTCSSKTWVKAHQSHVECVLETGRTHQIRKLLCLMGRPIYGEEIYRLNKKGKLVEQTTKQESKIRLFATMITFNFNNKVSC
jgi:23S rRNA pseudouridine1911/1915/1917 synthase